MQGAPKKDPVNADGVPGQVAERGVGLCSLGALRCLPRGHKIRVIIDVRGHSRGQLSEKYYIYTTLLINNPRYGSSIRSEMYFMRVFRIEWGSRGRRFESSHPDFKGI